ncbi:ABC transporter substrate-binding protein [Microbacterium sp. Root53]|uniref:ABC transporter substrate-binding protein n=1 Tax=Microbacterium sp. Root53 TaxID=1736553 RepID=UPI000AEB58FF|nr:extracellular solute-binding protein [Microbacterium sp. Root53]
MMLRRNVTSVCALVLTASALAGCSTAKAAEGSEEIALASGADRQQMLEEGAADEGKLMWYTTTIPDQLANPLAEAFEEKYPFADVEIYRANSTDVASKVIKEYQAGSHFVDVVDGTGTATMLESTDAIQPFTSPELDAYPDSAKDPEGFSAPQLMYFMAVAYNTDMVSPDDVPQTYEDLLDPKWKGRMSWSTSPTSGGPLFLGNLMEAWGEDRAMDYFDDLAAQQMQNVDASGRAVLDRVISGQVPIGVQLFNDQIVDAASKGAPVDWAPLNPVTAQYSRVALAKYPPHPHTAMLFLDFILSEEGQEIIRDGNGIPAHPEVDALTPELKPEQGGFEAQFTDPEQVMKQTNEWADLYEEMFM